MDEQTTRRKPSWRRIVIWVALAFLTSAAVADLAFVATMGVHLNGVESSPRMRDVADKLKTRPGWKLIYSEETIAPKNGALCFVPYCPELERVWDLDSDTLDCPALQGLIRDSGYTLIAYRDDFTPDANAELQTCTVSGYLSADGTDMGHSVTLTVSPGNDSLPPVPRTAGSHLVPFITKHV